jgi:hypothetical protein
MTPAGVRAGVRAPCITRRSGVGGPCRERPPPAIDVRATLCAPSPAAHDPRGLSHSADRRPSDKETDDMVFAADYPFLDIFWTQESQASRALA